MIDEKKKLSIPQQVESSNLFTACKVSKYRIFSGPYFPAFGLNTERYAVSLRIQSKCGKIWTRKTPNTSTFHAVTVLTLKQTLLPNTFEEEKYSTFFLRRNIIDNR